MGVMSTGYSVLKDGEDRETALLDDYTRSKTK